MGTLHDGCTYGSQEGEILIIIDAGGGTVVCVLPFAGFEVDEHVQDAVTERVQQAKPLKLSQCGIAKGKANIFMSVPTMSLLES